MCGTFVHSNIHSFFAFTTHKIMRKTKAEAQQTREALLAAALEVFYRRGVSQASLHEIACSAGVTRGALYWHFKSKEDLFDALFQQIFQVWMDQLDHDIAAQSPDIWHNFATAVTQAFMRLVSNESHRKFCHILHFNCEHTEHNHNIVQLLRQYQQLWRSRLCAVFALSLQQQKLPPDIDIDLAALYFQSMVMGLTDLWLSNPQAFDLSMVVPRFIATSMEALQHSPHLRRSAAE